MAQAAGPFLHRKQDALDSSLCSPEGLHHASVHLLFFEENGLELALRC